MGHKQSLYKRVCSGASRSHHQRTFENIGDSYSMPQSVGGVLVGVVIDGRIQSQSIGECRDNQVEGEQRERKTKEQAVRGTVCRSSDHRANRQSVRGRVKVGNTTLGWKWKMEKEMKKKMERRIRCRVSGHSKTNQMADSAKQSTAGKAIQRDAQRTDIVPTFS